MQALRKHWWWAALLAAACLLWLLMPKRAGGQSPLPGAPAASSDEPRAYQGPFTWTQKRMGLGATVTGEIKLRILPAAGKFTCFLSGTGPLEGTLVVGPSTTRMNGNVRMAASTCSGTWNPATGEISGSAQLRATTVGTATVDVAAGGHKQHSVQPMDSSSSDALTLRGITEGAQAHGVASYAKGGSFTWTAALAGGVAPPAPPPAAQPPGKPPAAGPQPLVGPSGGPSAAAPANPPGSNADHPKTAKAKAGQQQAKQALTQALAPVKAQANPADSFDEAAGKGMAEATKSAIQAGLQILDEATKANPHSDAAGPGSKAFQTADKINKAKEVLSDINEVRQSIQQLEQKVKAGEIRGDHGRMLKGTVILGKGLKLVVDKVPVVGWAGAEVVDKTFGVVVKVGSDFAKKTSTWDCCTADPAADCCE